MCSCLFTNLLFSFWKLAVHRLSVWVFLVLEGYNGTIQESHLPFLSQFVTQKKLEILLYRKKSPPTTGYHYQTLSRKFVKKTVISADSAQKR